MKFPFVKRRKLEKATDRIRYLQANLEKVREELEETKARIDGVLPELVRISFKKIPSSRRYRIAVDFDEEWVYRCFIHGDDQYMIGLVSERLSRLIERELRTINFQRLEEVRR